jgi:hypothetical protein
MNFTKNLSKYLSLPSPGPITQLVIAFYQAKILLTHSSDITSNYSSVNFLSISSERVNIP